MITRDKLNSRKFALAVGTILLATALLIAEYIEPDHFVTIVITIGGAYMAAQAWEDRGRVE